MAAVIDEIRRCDVAISNNIVELANNRGLMSVNIINNLRNLINQVAVLIATQDINADSNYPTIDSAMNLIKTSTDLVFLRTFYKQLQASASHYTPDSDGAERLMLKYYESLILIKKYLKDSFSIDILSNLEDFPLDTDESQQEYYEKIASQIESYTDKSGGTKDNYYIHRVKPFFVNQKVYYEITFSLAIDRNSKFHRKIAFSSKRIFGNYATDLWLRESIIEVDGIKVPIKIIQSWKVNIRPCEFNNLGRIIGFDVKANRGQKDYLPIMEYITQHHRSLVDIIDLSDELFKDFVNQVRPLEHKSTIIDLIIKLRCFCKTQITGKNVIRYLLLNMHNSTIKDQSPNNQFDSLDSVWLSKKTFPFDEMPFCTSLKNHNPRLEDVISAIPISGREYELIARRVMINTEQEGLLYSPKEKISSDDELDISINRYNAKLWSGHADRKIEKYAEHYFIKGYEQNVVEIVKILKTLCSGGGRDYKANVLEWLTNNGDKIDDPTKKAILANLFDSSKVAIIYGAAGTGKTRMIEHVSAYFSSESKIYLANTNTAVSNLKMRLGDSGDFMTVAKAIKSLGLNCSILFIDECSTISNRDMIALLQNIKFEHLVLVGDIYQIQSISFGNWFDIIKKFLPKQAVFELEAPFRTKDDNLKKLWNAVRMNSNEIEEIMERQGYSRKLDSSIFQELADEEIVLCLNYDGLYGVNNVNKILQAKNKNQPVVWNGEIYKVGDPIIFNESNAYSEVLYNNLRGKIVSINVINEAIIEFVVDIIGVTISERNAEWAGLELIDDNRVRIRVEKRRNNDGDDDSETLRSVVPFQVSYAVTIHKAQGLEYESVKVVVTKDSEEKITKNIFYTAITRATKRLTVYCSPEAQYKIILSFIGNINNDHKLFLKRNHNSLK